MLGMIFRRIGMGLSCFLYYVLILCASTVIIAWIFHQLQTIGAFTSFLGWFEKNAPILGLIVGSCWVRTQVDEFAYPLFPFIISLLSSSMFALLTWWAVHGTFQSYSLLMPVQPFYYPDDLLIGFPVIGLLCMVVLGMIKF